LLGDVARGKSGKLRDEGRGKRRGKGVKTWSAKKERVTKTSDGTKGPIIAAH